MNCIERPLRGANFGNLLIIILVVVVIVCA